MSLIDQSESPRNADPQVSARDASDTTNASETPACMAVGPDDAGRLEAPPPNVRASFGDHLQHWLLLVACLLVIALSCLLQVRGSTQVVLPGLNRPLPGICTFRRLTGQPCPGCGLTRSFVSIAHGDLVAAWRFNPAGLLVFVVVAAQIPYRAIQLWRIRRGRDELPATTFAYGVVWIMVAALIGQWFVRLFWEVFPKWN